MLFRSIPADAVMPYPTIGILGYSLPTLTIIDEFGLTDRVIARAAAPPNEQRILAHDRRPPPGYLEQRGVNVDVLPAAPGVDVALAFAPWALRIRDDLWMPLHVRDADWARRAFDRARLVHAGLDGADPAQCEILWLGRGWRGERWLGRFDDGTVDGWEAGG